MKQYKFKINGNSYSVSIKDIEDNNIELEVNGSAFFVEMEKEVKSIKTPKLFRADPKPSHEVNKLNTQASTRKVTAPLPGVLIEILVKEGDVVKTGDKLAGLEAMKMENSIMAESGGKIKSILTKAGASVLQGDVLLEIE